MTTQVLPADEASLALASRLLADDLDMLLGWDRHLRHHT